MRTDWFVFSFRAFLKRCLAGGAAARVAACALPCVLSLVPALALPLFGTPDAACAAPAGRVPLHAGVEPVLSWRTPLTITLAPDRNFCRGQMGRDAPACRGRLGEEGAPVPGIALHPAVAGTWRWSRGNRLVFTPEEPFVPGTVYSADLRALPLPPGVTLITPKADAGGARRVSIPTLALAAVADDFDVWIDPAPRGRHVVSATIRFSWPVIPDEMERRISLRPVAEGAGQDARAGTEAGSGPESARKLRLGKEEFVWNQDRDEVTVSAPLLSLAAAQGPVEARVRGLPLWNRKGETCRQATRPTADGDVTGRVLVPGRRELLQVRRLDLAGGRNASLDWEYRLELETSLHVDPQAVARALRVTALPRNIGPRPGSAARSETDRLYDWTRAPVVSAEDLARGTPLKVTPLNASGAPDTGNAPTSRMRFRVDAPAGSYLFVSLPAGFASPEGYSLARRWEGVFRAVPPEPEINFLQPGNVLPLGGSRKIALQTAGLTAIRWELRRVREPFLALFAQEWGGFAADSAPDRYTDIARGEIPLPAETPETEAETGAEVDSGSGSAPRPEPGRARFASLDVAESWPFGLMEARLTGLNGERIVAATSRLVLLTDMGMFVKKASDGRRDVFVCSLSSGRPLAGVSVRILGRNGLPVAEAATDGEGRAVLPATDGLSMGGLSADGLSAERAPVAIVASRSGSRGEPVDFTWLSLSDPTRIVDTSAFPVGGRSASEEGLTAYVFSQRGLFRPGETLHFGCIARRGDWQALPEKLPLHAVLTDPLGNEVLSRPFAVPADGLAELSWHAPEAAPVGRYRLDVSIGERGPVIGSGAVRVEEFQPDTLELRVSITATNADAPVDPKDQPGDAPNEGKSDPGSPRGWIVIGDNAGLQAVARLRNLYGLPAQNRRVRATLGLTPAAFAFPGYEDYHFYDPAPCRGAGAAETLPEVRTDAAGTARFTLPVGRHQAATMRATLFTEGFEPGGGRAVTRADSVLLSPLRVALGFRPAGEGANLGHIPQGRKAALDFIALDPALNRVDPGELRFAVAARRSVRSLIRDARGRYRYDETPVEAPLAQSVARFDNKKSLRWFLPTDTPGDFLLTVASSSGEPLAETAFTVVGDALIVPEQERHGAGSLAAGGLRLRLDRDAYAPGDAIRIALNAPYAGSGLIAVERDGVAAWRWFSAPAGESVQSIVLPPDFEGKGYVTAALIRSPDSPDIYMEPLSSAVAPFSVDPGRRDMGLALSAPRLVRPGERVDVTLTSRAPGRAIVFAVDEGVLSATDFRTPSPLEYLLRDRALDVETRQAFDLLMPDHARLAGRLPAFGGGMEGAGGGRFLNPFKRRGEPPLTAWSSIIPVSPEGSRFSFTVPEWFNGEVRIMAVGASAAAAGNAEARLAARGPVTLTPQLPLAVAPGDRFEAAVGVANSAEGMGEAGLFRLRVETEGGLVLAGDGEREASLPPVRIRRGDEAVFRFELRAADTPDAPGEARVRLLAEAVPAPEGNDGAAGGQQGRAQGGGDAPKPGGESGSASGGAFDTALSEDAVWENALTATRTVSLSVRPAAPYRQSVRAGVARAGETRVPVQRERYALRRSDVFEASRVPLPMLRGLARRLDMYPHGCTEQLLSRAFSCVALAGRPDLLADPRRDAAAVLRDGDAVIDAAIQALRASFSRNGVGLWPGAIPNETVTVYAGDFLLALRETGWTAPASLENAVFDAIERLTERAPATLAQARVRAYGLWVLTREGRIVTRALDQLEQSLNEMSLNARGRDGKAGIDWRRDVTGALLAGSCAILRLDGRAEELLMPTAAGPAAALENDAAAIAAADAFPTGDILDATAAAALRVTVLARHFPERLTGDGGQAGMEEWTRFLHERVEGGTFAAAHSVRALLALTLASPPSRDESGVRIECAEAGGSAAVMEPEAGAEAGSEPPLSIPGLYRLEAACSVFRLHAPAGESWYWQLTSGGYDMTLPARAESRGMEVTLALAGPEAEDVAGRFAPPAGSPETPGTIGGNGAGERGGPARAAGSAKQAGSSRPPRPDAPLSVALGDVVTLSVTARSHGPAIPNAVITVPLPGGFEAIPFRGEGETADAPVTHRETREDRVLFYVDLDAAPRTWTCRLRAVNTGDFVLPPAQAEAMYDATLSARSESARLAVRQPSDEE